MIPCLNNMSDNRALRMYLNIKKLASALPYFEAEGGDRIHIFDENAYIVWILDTDHVTHVLVESCLMTDRHQCLMTSVTDLEQSQVIVGVPSGGQDYIFTFYIYDGEDLVKEFQCTGLRVPF